MSEQTTHGTQDPLADHRTATAGEAIASPGVYVGRPQPSEIGEAVIAAGGRLAALEDADAVVWLDPDPSSLPPLPPRVRWVQFPGAGAEQWVERVRAESDVVFTTASGVYGIPVAEHALALLLAGVRRIVVSARTQQWRPVRGHTLEGATVAIIGAGGIGRALIPMLTPLHARVIAVTRRGLPVEGAAETLAADRIDEVWGRSDHFVVAAPSTAQTRHLISRRQLGAMRPHAWIVNIARGPLIDTDALVSALRREAIGGAALDVTDPEPLPDGHPLWSEPRALITPHAGPALHVHYRHLGNRVRENLQRLRGGEPLLYPIDADVGY